MLSPKMNLKITVFAAALLLYGKSFAGVDKISAIGPATSASNVTVSAAGSGVKNCVTDVDVVSASTFTFRILNGNTTSYALGPLAAGSSLVRSWDDSSAYCSDANTALQLKVDNGTFSINYNGYTR